MQVKLRELCSHAISERSRSEKLCSCSLAILPAEDLDSIYDYTLEIEAETAERWRIIMRHYDRVQGEMRAAIATRHAN